jgi:hypothetical protein
MSLNHPLPFQYYLNFNHVLQCLKEDFRLLEVLCNDVKNRPSSRHE